MIFTIGYFVLGSARYCHASVLRSSLLGAHETCIPFSQHFWSPTYWIWAEMLGWPKPSLELQHDYFYQSWASMPTIFHKSDMSCSVSSLESTIENYWSSAGLPSPMTCTVPTCFSYWCLMLCSWPQHWKLSWSAPEVASWHSASEPYVATFSIYFHEISSDKHPDSSCRTLAAKKKDMLTCLSISLHSRKLTRFGIITFLYFTVLFSYFYFWILVYQLFYL